MGLMVPLPLIARQRQIESVVGVMASKQPNNDESINRRDADGRLAHMKSCFDTVNALFPTAETEVRNSASRTDGYWKYVQHNKEPPLEFTYGEFPLDSFARVVDRAFDIFPTARTFLDMGSGAGRLATLASIMYPFEHCRGIEILNSLHDLALSIQGAASIDRVSNIDYICGSWSDPYLFFGDADITFVYSSCLGTEQLHDLAKSLGRQLKVGAVVITTEFPLPPASPPSSYSFEIKDSFDVENSLVGGKSTVYIHTATSTGYYDGLKEWMETTKPSDDELAAIAAIKDIEDRYNPGFEIFKRNYQNNCIFHGLPEFLYKNEN